MTTPHQMAPDGAYVIGDGGGQYTYGQGLTDPAAAQLMLNGFTLLTDPIGAVAKIAETLLTLPLEVLQLFAPMIPGFEGGFETVVQAVEAITGFFQSLGPMLLTSFNEWVTTTFNILNTTVNQIMDIVNGLVVVPINEAVQGVFDWWNAIMGSVSGLTTRQETLTANVLELQAKTFGEGGADGINNDFAGAAQDPLVGVRHLKFGFASEGRIGRGDGKMIWYPGITGSAQVDFAIFNTGPRIGSTTQKTLWGLATAIAGDGDCSLFIPLRANDDIKTNFDCQYIRLMGNELRFGYCLNGVLHDFTAGELGGSLAPIAYTQDINDIWGYQVGDDWLQRVWLNNDSIFEDSVDLTTFDAGLSVLLDANHDYPAGGMSAHGVFIPPFIPFQIEPGRVEAMSHFQPAA